MSLFISHGLDMGWKYWGQWLEETGKLVVTLCPMEYDDDGDPLSGEPDWWLQITRAYHYAEIMDPNYTTLTQTATMEMAATLKSWLTDPEALFKADDLGISIGWCGIANQLIEGIEREGGCFSFG